MFLLQSFIFIIGIVRVELAFSNEVKPKCPASEDECTFDLRINYIMSMVSYNWTTGDGSPVFSRNGTFYKKLAFPVGPIRHYCQVTPLQESEMEEVVTVDGNYKFLFAINNQFPGPTLVVYEDQTIKIRVYNDLTNEAVTIHWHGMFQSGTPWMDGVSMLTQCPILPGQMFTYKFKASPSGTHWYHSHHGAMRREGLSGAFIVLPRPGKERTDIPRVDKDVLLITQDWSAHKSDVQAVTEQNWYMLQFANNLNTASCLASVRTYDGSLSTLLRPYANALINGKSKSFSEDSSENQRSVPLEIFTVTQNSSTRFRIMNTGSTGEYKISIDEHKLLLISSDGSDLSPIWIDYLFINPGETYDIILESNNTPGNFWIRVATIEVMDINFNQIQPNVSFAQLHYQEAEVDLPDSEERKCTESEPCVMANCHWSQITMSKWEPYSTCLSIADLKSIPTNDQSESPIAAPESLGQFQEFFFNFHFTGSDELLERPAVNSIHYKNPPVPLQMYPDTVNDKGVVCDNRNMDQCDAFCKCTHVVKLAKKKVTQIVLMAEDGLPRGVSHPVHLHGNRFYVVKNANGEINETTGITQGRNQDIEYSSDMRSATWRNSSWKNGNVPGINLKDPPQKDTVMIPYRGYVVIRLLTDKIGFWLMHCHLEAHMDIGMAVVLQVGEEDEQPKYPSDIPSCSNYDPGSTPKSAHDSEGDVKETNFLQMSDSEGETTLGSQNTKVSGVHGMSTTHVVMVVFLAVFFTGMIVFSMMLLVSYCRRRRGYRRIDKNQRVIFQK